MALSKKQEYLRELAHAIYMRKSTSSYIEVSKNYYIGLSKTAPDVNGDGCSEPTDLVYKRVLYPMNTGTTTNNLSDFRRFKNDIDAIVVNNFPIQFEKATANWGNMTHYLIFTGISDLQPVFWGALTSPITINSGDIAAITRDELELQLFNA